MSDWEASLDAARDDFVEAMRRVGFPFDERATVVRGVPTLVGEVCTPQGPFDVEIQLHEKWPYRPPKVRPSRPQATMGWHQEHDGSMCLFAAGEAGLPWLNASVLVDRIGQWLTNTANGWPQDAPDLDLERYFPDRAPGLVVYDDVDALIGKTVRVAKFGAAFELRRSGRPKKKGLAQKLKPTLAHVYDVGELDSPLRDWDDIASRLSPADAEQFMESLRAVGALYLVLAYLRGGVRGMLVLWATAAAKGQVQLAAIESAGQSQEVRKLRAGVDASMLADKSVAIVGVGAVGSFAADLLARAGSRRLILCDGARLRPGNCVRHLAPLKDVGKMKPAAVRGVLERTGYAPERGIEEKSSIETLEGAIALCREVDVVVEATGSFAIAAMFADASGHAGTTVVSAYLQREGSVARVDRFPRHPDEPVVAPVAPLPVSERSSLREGGCGDPVSPAPPHSAITAASLAVAITIDVLGGRPTRTSVVCAVDGTPRTQP